MENNNNEQGGFFYVYSAKEQAELKRIREKYASPAKTEDKMSRLRRLDAGVTQKAQSAALVFGVIGALLLGLGMSLVMTELAAMLGLSSVWAIVIGVCVGLIGGTLAALAYPVYNAVVKRERARVAPEILALTDELMK